MKTGRQQFWSVLLISLIMLISLYPGIAYSSSSKNYHMSQMIMDAGGGVRNSSHYTLSDSLGQSSAVTVSASSKYSHTPAFYVGVAFSSGQSLGPSKRTERALTHSGEFSDAEMTSAPSSFSEAHTPAAVPEPTTFLLFVTGGLGLCLVIRRNRRKRR